MYAEYQLEENEKGTYGKILELLSKNEKISSFFKVLFYNLL